MFANGFTSSIFTVSSGKRGCGAESLRAGRLSLAPLVVSPLQVLGPPFTCARLKGQLSLCPPAQAAPPFKNALILLSFFIWILRVLQGLPRDLSHSLPSVLPLNSVCVV